MRLINVSNRLPITVIKRDGKHNVTRSIGGVATGLDSFLKHYKNASNNEVLWVGWPGISLKDDGMLKEKLKELSCYSIQLSKEIIDDYYHGFCNKTLWPLFHCLVTHAIYKEYQWLAYQYVNKIFCDAIAEIIEPDDYIWVHDYQLLLLPQLIKERFPNIKVGFFLHISFPSFNILQFLPKACREQLLQGVLGADLIGFHTHEYSQQFMRVVRRTLGFEQYMGYINTHQRRVKIAVYPMGVDVDGIQALLGSKEVIKQQAQLIDATSPAKIILSVDRLDYTKGIINKLLAFQMFLETNTEWHTQIVLALIVAPSREEISSYAVIKKEIDELVGAINGKFGNVKWLPILYQYKSFSMEQMVAYYAAANVAFITPFRDGMNLIAKEFVAAKKQTRGALILSETAGAAKELLGSIIVNPNCELEMVIALKQALEMPMQEQEKRMQSMQAMLQKYNIVNWGDKFISDLLETKNCFINLKEKMLDSDKLYVIKNNFTNAQSRLITLDYDGTLVPFVNDPNKAVPSAETLSLISAFSDDERNHVVIISGRNKEILEKWFGHLNVTLVAEHSGWIKDKIWRKNHILSSHWKEHIRSILQIFADRLEGSCVEEKEFSLAWHYRAADEGKGEELAKELSDYLIGYTDESDLKIILGKKVVEVKCSQVGKNYAIEKLLATNKYDFVLAVGDDITDEDMFLALPNNAISIKVGEENSYAKFHVPVHHDVLMLLNLLSACI